ncbi:MAG: patatin-like phospholipase family protein [Parvularculaceae bacterium]
MATPAAKRVNLALQGGGAHGAVTWGVLDRLLEDDRLDIEAISGTSAGAVNAVALAYGLHLDGRAGARAKLDELWRLVSDIGGLYSPVKRTPFEMAMGDFNLDDSFSYQAFDAFTRLFSPYQFNPFDINPLRDILKRLVDFESLRECKATQLFLSATNVRNGKVKVFRTRDVSVDVVCASACLPFLFKAVEINGEHYWDGGFMGNPVLWPFFYEAQSRDIVIVHVNPIERDALPVTSSEIVNRMNEISFNASLLREFRAISFAQKLLAERWLKEEYADRVRDIHVHSIRSDKAIVDLSIASKFSVDRRFLEELRNRGREIADAWLEENFKHIGRRSSVDLRAMIDGG